MMPPTSWFWRIVPAAPDVAIFAAAPYHFSSAVHPPRILRVKTFPYLGRCTRRGRLSLSAPGR